jgi:hypothetical protein
MSCEKASLCPNRRLQKAKKLLSRLKHPVAANQLIFFSNEKNFYNYNI